MALPAANSPWPPPDQARIAATMTTHAAWYEGNPDRLSKVYQAAARVLPDNRPSQYRGGVVGALARFWWGKPIPAGERDYRRHVPIAADIATASADLLFAEPPRIVLPDAAKTNAKAQARLDQVLDGLDALLNESAESCSALGGVYLRAGWDTDVADMPLTDVVQADTAVPEFRRGRLVAVTLVETLSVDGDRVLRHIERHEIGRIEHGLYLGTSTSLGKSLPLGDHPATADLPELVTVPGRRLAVVYVPNMLPRRDNRTTRQGRSDYAGAEPLMDALDETYSSWLRDIRLAKARLIVPATMLTDLGPGQGAGFDVDREVYEGLNMPPNAQQQITPQQFAIRVEEHRRTALELRELIVGAAGYSPQTFGMYAEGAAPMTATEVDAREDRSSATRRKKINYWRPALAYHARTLLEIDREVFRQPSPPADPVVDWPAQSAPTILELAQTAQALRTAEAASDETLVRLVHPDWDDTAVQGEVARIVAERDTKAAASAVPDPLAALPI